MAIDFTFTGRNDAPVPTIANTMSATYGGLGSKNAPSFGNEPKMPIIGTPTGGLSGQRFADLQRALASTGYQQSDVQRDRAMSMDDLARQFVDQRRGIPGQFNRRGMLDSGQFQRGMGRSFADELRRRGRLEMAAQQALNSLAQRRVAAEQQYAAGRLQDALAAAAARAQATAQPADIARMLAQGGG